MRYAMIMAGGSGTRLWPMSRDGQPKQLIDFIHQPDGSRASLLALAADRMNQICDPSRQFICTGERYRAHLNASLPSFPNDNILGEPEPRDTVNAVAFGAAVFAKQDPDAVFSVLTADQLIEPADIFNAAMQLGYELVEADHSRLVTFGITPTHPATGYGDIERGKPIPNTDNNAYIVERFVEKPQLETAEAYIESGRFEWNAGMFVFHAQTFLELYTRYLPNNADLIDQLADAWGTDAQQQVLGDVYPQLEKTSVDYGVMEPASNAPDVTIVGVKMPITWLDVGSWPAYAETLTPDAHDNRVAGVNLTALDAHNNVVIGEGAQDSRHTIALVGVNDLIVVRTKRATLIIPKDRAQDIKKLHERLTDDLR